MGYEIDCAKLLQALREHAARYVEDLVDDDDYQVSDKLLIIKALAEGWNPDFQYAVAEWHTACLELGVGERYVEHILEEHDEKNIIECILPPLLSQAKDYLVSLEEERSGYEYAGKIAPQLSMEDRFLVRNIILAQRSEALDYLFVGDGQEICVEIADGVTRGYGKIDEKKQRKSSRHGIANTIRAKRAKMLRIRNAIAKTEELQGMSESAKELAEAVVNVLQAEIAVFKAIKDRV